MIAENLLLSEYDDSTLDQLSTAARLILAEIVMRKHTTRVGKMQEPITCRVATVMGEDGNVFSYSHLTGEQAVQFPALGVDCDYRDLILQHMTDVAKTFSGDYVNPAGQIKSIPQPDWDKIEPGKFELHFDKLRFALRYKSERGIAVVMSTSGIILLNKYSWPSSIIKINHSTGPKTGFVDQVAELEKIRKFRSLYAHSGSW